MYFKGRVTSFPGKTQKFDEAHILAEIVSDLPLILSVGCILKIYMIKAFAS